MQYIISTIGKAKNSDEDIIKDYFPKAKMATISKEGHWLHAENPKEFIEVTSKWLNEFG